MYKIAIFSDSHDNMPAIRQAVSIAVKNSVSYILHAGDFVAPFALLPIIDADVEWRGVIGNNDGEVKGLIAKSGNRIKECYLEVELNSRNIFMVHKPEDIPGSADGYDVVIHGHTHEHYVEKRDSSLWINPGEVCGYLSASKSFVILDLDSMEPETIYF